jgi:hypothetical protein
MSTPESKESSLILNALSEVREDINKLTNAKRSEASKDVVAKWNELVRKCPSLDLQIHTVDVHNEEDRAEGITIKWKYILDGA